MVEAPPPTPVPPTEVAPWWRRRWVAVAVAALAAAVAFGAVTAVTGFPGPGGLRRYPRAQLQELVDAVHADAGPVRTPDDCWRTLNGADGPLRDVARVDHLRSRVVVRAWASDDGLVDRSTWSRVAGRIEAVLAAHPELDPGMVEIEGSPDGWSPTTNCARITRGPVTGF